MSENMGKKAQTEASAQAPGAGGLSPQAEEILGRVKPVMTTIAVAPSATHVIFKEGLYYVDAAPNRLIIRHGEPPLSTELRIELEEPAPPLPKGLRGEPNLADILRYWLRVVEQKVCSTLWELNWREVDKIEQAQEAFFSSAFEEAESA